MWPENIEIITAAVSLLVMTGSFISWLWERSSRKKLQVEHKRRIWSEISKVRGLMSDLEKDDEKAHLSPGINQAVGKLTFMYRDLLREALTLEKKPCIETIHNWRKVGKLGSDWQQQMALSMLLSEEIEVQKIELIEGDYGKADELPTSHAHSANLNIVSER